MSETKGVSVSNMPNKRKPLLSKLDSGGGLTGPAGSSGSRGPSGDKIYDDINKGVGKFFDLVIDMIEEVFDVNLKRTKKKGKKSKFW